jgi:Asp/Glu/hydantoin racemase
VPGKRVAFINTVSSLPAVFKSLVNELVPQLDTFSIVDESLLQDTIRGGALSKTTIRRLISYLTLAQEAGADMVMVTCSSIGPAADIGRSMVDGVAATLITTLMPTAALIERKASEAGKKLTIVSKLCSGAFEALMAGDTARHDRLVEDGLRELIPNVDVIVLAQASMARIVDALPQSEKVLPIYSSPRLAVEHLARLVAVN